MSSSSDPPRSSPSAIVAVAQQQAAKIQRVRQAQDSVAAEHVVDLGGWFGRLAVVEYTCRVEVAKGDRGLRLLPRTKGMPGVVDVTIAGMDNLDQRCLALLARINRYPVTDPTARARMLGEIEAIHRAERERLDPKVAGSNGGSDVGTIPDPPLTY